MEGRIIDRAMAVNICDPPTHDKPQRSQSPCSSLIPPTSHPPGYWHQWGTKGYPSDFLLSLLGKWLQLACCTHQKQPFYNTVLNLSPSQREPSSDQAARHARHLSSLCQSQALNLKTELTEQQTARTASILFVLILSSIYIYLFNDNKKTLFF